MLSLWLGILKILVVLLLKYLFFFFFFFFLISIWVEIFTKKKKLYDQDLSEYIRGHSTNIPSDIILKLTSDIAAGMNMVNEFGIVHRDLKPYSFLFFFIIMISLNFCISFQTSLQIKYIIGKRKWEIECYYLWFWFGKS